MDRDGSPEGSAVKNRARNEAEEKRQQGMGMNGVV